MKFSEPPRIYHGFPKCLWNTPNFFEVFRTSLRFSELPWKSWNCLWVLGSSLNPSEFLRASLKFSEITSNPRKFSELIISLNGSWNSRSIPEVLRTSQKSSWFFFSKSSKLSRSSRNIPEVVRTFPKFFEVSMAFLDASRNSLNFSEVFRKSQNYSEISSIPWNFSIVQRISRGIQRSHEKFGEIPRILEQLQEFQGSSKIFRDFPSTLWKFQEF